MIDSIYRILIIKLLIIHKNGYFKHNINNINLFLFFIFSNVVEFHKLLATNIRVGNSNKNIFIISWHNLAKLFKLV